MSGRGYPKFTDGGRKERRRNLALAELDCEIAGLIDRSTPELPRTWRTLHHTEPPLGLSRDLIPRRSAIPPMPLPKERVMKRLHVHVAVDDLAQSIRFYSTLFAAEPAVVKEDYAKWMLLPSRMRSTTEIDGNGVAAAQKDPDVLAGSEFITTRNKCCERGSTSGLGNHPQRLPKHLLRPDDCLVRNQDDAVQQARGDRVHERAYTAGVRENPPRSRQRGRRLVLLP